MAEKKTQSHNGEEPTAEPDNEQEQSGSDPGGKAAASDTPFAVPQWAKEFPLGSQGAAAEPSPRIEIEEVAQPAEQVASEAEPAANLGPANADDKKEFRPGEGTVTPAHAAEQGAQPSPDYIDEIRRMLREEHPPESRPKLIPGILEWWKSTMPGRGKKSEEDARIDSHVDDASLSLPAVPAFYKQDVDEAHIGEFFGELDKIAASDADVPEGDISADGATGAQNAAMPQVDPSGGGSAAVQSTDKPAEAVTGTEMETRPAEGTPAVERTSYELSTPPHVDAGDAEVYENIRAAALQDFEEAPAETDKAAPMTLREFLSRSLKDLRPSAKRWLAAGLILIVGLAVISGALLMASRRPTPPTPTPFIALGVSQPAALRFPGGWDFSLAVGKLQNGEWSPNGPEWLQGTEISRWVSLPWSEQLEAVFQTLKSGDNVDLVMTNSDHLRYTIQSVQQRNVDQIAAINKTVPSLVIFLSKKGSKEIWVITAVP